MGITGTRHRESTNSSTNITTKLSEMAFIQAGVFLMGTEDGGEFERPAHEVSLDDFWMDQTPVTNQQFAEFVQDTGYVTEAELRGEALGYREGKYTIISGLCWRSYALPGCNDNPVVLISWYDASAYAKSVGKRLPTEAEWEKAARGGKAGSTYFWGEETPNGTQCNFARKPSEIPPVTSVKKFQPNAYGLYDMVGNVWQWCADWHLNEYYENSPIYNPTGPEVGICRVRRGGSWNVIQSFRLRSANRGALDPSNVAPNVGFRCALSKPVLNQELMIKHPTSVVHQIQSASDYPNLNLNGKHDLTLNEEDGIRAKIEQVLNHLRPAMQADGGNVKLVKVEYGVVYVELQGTCLHCPSASLTIKHGIEHTLKEQIPGITKVVRVL